MERYISELNKLYQNNNLIIGEKNVLLHENCIYCNKCWTDKSRLNRGKDWNKISFPYIGEKYGEKSNIDLMCIGLNLNRYGGGNAIKEIFNGNKNHPGVIKFLEMGKIRINFNDPNYHGTILWHRLTVYSNIILNGIVSLKGDVSPSSTDSLGKESVIASILKGITYLNAIKCSPEDKQSSPESEMFNYCPENIMFKEIAILKPKIILFMGKEVSVKFMKKFDCKNIKSTKNINYYEVLFNKDIIKVFKIKHPTARGGSSLKLYYELLEVRNEKIGDI